MYFPEHVGARAVEGETQEHSHDEHSYPYRHNPIAASGRRAQAWDWQDIRDQFDPDDNLVCAGIDPRRLREFPAIIIVVSGASLRRQHYP